ncbi:MAG TPA: tRNA pseudouridine(38-40) synthase TruA [Longimicrobiales bacterium]|nr:tRNA pseudouridine(38-40) synthase TruA [Longimicrobiales bacterium]
MTLSTQRLERRVKLTLHYDGAGFMGWQVQPGARTVQAELEDALSRLVDQPISVIAAGRTDRGVHAIGQVASALVPAKWTAAALRRALNAILPEDIWVSAAREVPLEFHARYSATARSYEYRVGTAEEAFSPFHRRWCWPLRDTVNRAALDEAAAQLLGRHSFRAFAKSGQPERGDQCEVSASSWRTWECGLTYEIRANRFLHHMVRYLVGTMVDMARGRRPLGDLRQLLANAQGLETSPPAPPEGLFLLDVVYPPATEGREELE